MSNFRMFADHGVVHSPFVAPASLDFQAFNKVHQPKPITPKDKDEGVTLTFDKNFAFKGVYEEDIDIRDLIRNFNQQQPKEKNKKYQKLLEMAQAKKARNEKPKLQSYLTRKFEKYQRKQQ